MPNPGPADAGIPASRNLRRVEVVGVATEARQPDGGTACHEAALRILRRKGRAHGRPSGVEEVPMPPRMATMFRRTLAGFLPATAPTAEEREAALAALRAGGMEPPPGLDPARAGRPH